MITVAKANEFVGRWFPLLLLSTACLGYVAGDYVTFINHYLKVVVVLSIFFVGTQVRLTEVRDQIRTPIRLGFSLLVTLAVVPAATYLLVQPWSTFSPELAAGLLLISALPTGTMAVVWTRLLEGDAALSLSSLLTSTVLAGFWAPAVLYLTLRQLISLDVGALMRSTLLTVFVPVLLGLTFNTKWPNLARRTATHSSLAIKIMTPIVTLANGGALRESIPSLFSVPMAINLAAVVSWIFSVYVVAFVAGKVLHG